MVKHFTPVVLALTLLSSPAFAKTTRHCVDKTNKEIALSGTAKTPAAQCKAAGGKWVKVKAASTNSTSTTAAPTTTTPKSK